MKNFIPHNKAAFPRQGKRVPKKPKKVLVKLWRKQIIQEIIHADGGFEIKSVIQDKTR